MHSTFYKHNKTYYELNKLTSVNLGEYMYILFSLKLFVSIMKLFRVIILFFILKNIYTI